MPGTRNTTVALKTFIKESSANRRQNIDNVAINPLHHMLLTIINSVDMSAAELSELTGVSKTGVCDLRRGKKLGSLHTWNKIIVGLGAEIGHRYK